MTPKRSLVPLAALSACALLLSACGGGSSSSSPTPAPTGNVALLLSDGAAEDWAVIGVKVLGVALVPQGGGAPVPVYSAPATAPWVNLVQLDQLAELLGNVQVPAGTYGRAVLTVGANPGDVQLVSSADPSPGFPLPASTTVPSDQIAVRGASGPAGSRTAQVRVALEQPLVVTDGGSNALDLEFDLRHPALVVEHLPASGTPVWTVNLEGPVRHRPIRHLAELVLRHVYGDVTAVTASSLTLTRVAPARPVTTPETAVATDRSLQVDVDATNGTIVYDLDARTRTVMTDLSSLAASLPGKYVRVAARYQADGSLWAVRVWVSSTFARVWADPEGHVLHVNTGTDRLWVESETGAPVRLTVNDQTRFYFRTPAKAQADATPIGTGTAFLANLHRGFKVHVGVVDPLAAELVADTVDVEIARFGGALSLMTPAGTGLVYTRTFATAPDDYTQPLPYLSPSTPNVAPDGTPITGFDWWDFTFPTLAHTGADAVPTFEAAAGGSVDFGGTLGTLKVQGESDAVWADPANPTGWAARFAILVPSRAPLGRVASPFTAGRGGGSFGMVAAMDPASTVTTQVSTTPGSATLVYAIDRTGTDVTITPVDVSTAGGQATLSSDLVNGALVKAFGVPRPDGALAAYVLFVYAGTAPAI